MKPIVRASLGLVFGALLAGCSDFARLVTPAGPADARPARIAMTASVATASRSAADVAALRVVSMYLGADGARTTIATQTLTLSSAATQALPIPVELAGCLADGNRLGAASDASCSVVLELSLSVNGEVVDRQTVGPLRLSPGVTTNVSQPVTLFEIAAIDLAPSTPITLAPGASATVTSTIRDARGQAVSGRTVAYTSEAPTIATVDANGRITAVGVGATRVVASLGELSNGVNVIVARPPVALSVSSTAGSGSGVVRSTPAGIDCRIVGAATSGACAFAFAADAQVTLTSIADAGQQFAAWGGACAGRAVGSGCVLTMAQAQTASAQFVAIRRVTIAATSDDGRGRVTGPQGVDCRITAGSASGSCSANVPDGASITLTAVPDAGSGAALTQVFAGWGGVCSSAATATCVVTPNGADLGVWAGFHDGRALTVTTTGVGNGSITSASGIACTRSAGVTTGVCSQELVHGTSVTLIPVPDAVSELSAWGGACEGQSLTSCTVALTQSRAVTATFTRRRVTLTLRLVGAGAGITRANGALACARNSTDGAVECTRAFDLGSLVRLEAEPDPLSDFAGYSGDCTGFAACTLSMTADRVVTATFSVGAALRLTVAPRVTIGSGTVRSTEATPLINCIITDGVATGGRCTADVTRGTSITLRATGSVGNALGSWGAGCSGRTTYECTVTVGTSLDVFVGFVPAVDVEMRLVGPGIGSVTFQPLGVPSQMPCVIAAPGTSATCRFSLPESSTEGVFRGVAGAASTFGGFVGPCAESTGPGSVPVCTYRGIGFLRIITGTFTSP